MSLKEMEMRNVLVEFLREQMKKDSRVVLLDADLAKCSNTFTLIREFPDRALDVGIAEANMMGLAGGLSAYGFIPFVHSFAPFVSRRAADQVMISLAYAKQNVKIIGTDPGISAQLNGGTHMPLEDIAIFRSIPGMVIYEPTDNVEFKAMLPQIMDFKGVLYIRMFRKCAPAVYEEDEKDFNLFKSKVIKEGKDVTIIASGIMISNAMEAAKALEEEGISAEVIANPTIKPFDSETLLTSVKKTKAVVTAENHNVIGALRSAVAETLAENYPAPLESVGAKDRFGEVGKLPYLRKAFHMETIDVIDAVKKVLARK